MSLGNRLIAAGLIVAGVAATAALVGSFLRPAKAQVTIISPIATSTTVGTTSAQIVGPSPSRKAISICNGSSITNTIAIAPLGITPVTGATGTGVQLAAATCFTSPTSAAAPIAATSGWNGIGSASNVTITVLEWF